MRLFDDSAGWPAVGTLAAAALLLALVIVLLLRWRKAATREIAEMKEASLRTEKLIADVEVALEKARNERRRSGESERSARALEHVGPTLDLDTALSRALQAGTEVSGADAAMIVLTAGREEAVVATFGLASTESSPELVGMPPGTGPARAVKLSFLYSEEEVLNDAFRLTGGLAVPLSTEEGEKVGTFAIFWRRVEHETGGDEVARFEELAAAFGPVLENARRFTEARGLADTDPLTGLHNHRYFHARLARECARARRYDRRLALALLDVADSGDGAALSALGERLRSAVRASDVACHLGEGRFALIVPEVGRADAENLVRRLALVLDRRFSGAVAEHEAAEDASTLVSRAENALRAESPDA